MRYGKAYASLFSRELALILSHPEWQRFYIEVLARDASTKQDTRLSRDMKHNPMLGFKLLLEGHPAMESALPASIPKPEELLTMRQRQACLLWCVLPKHAVSVGDTDWLYTLHRAPWFSTLLGWRQCGMRSSSTGRSS